MVELILLIHNNIYLHNFNNKLYKHKKLDNNKINFKVQQLILIQDLNFVNFIMIELNIFFV